MESRTAKSATTPGRRSSVKSLEVVSTQVAMRTWPARRCNFGCRRPKSGKKRALRSTESDELGRAGVIAFGFLEGAKNPSAETFLHGLTAHAENAGDLFPSMLGARAHIPPAVLSGLATDGNGVDELLLEQRLTFHHVGQDLERAQLTLLCGGSWRFGNLG
jgi:hypothetical protein